ncbi:hypothetical protein [Dyella sp.]|uniref:hypothetical protein n=1 Tax=Dyella sp. TaxID=1869338 RepID=UPI002ED33A15
MSWFDRFKNGAAPPPATDTQHDLAGDPAQRQQAWEQALREHRPPSFVTERLQQAAQGKLPWIATMTPAELALTRSHGIRPVATVSGTCWFHYGFSWTNGHASGWHSALRRLQREAAVAGAHAVVDVRMRKIELELGDSMDFTLIGTAVRIEGLPPSDEPVVSTVSALEFARLLEAGVVPVGIAVGGHYEWLPESWRNLSATGGWVNQPLKELGGFWERVRRVALTQLRQDTHAQGNGALAHTHFGQLLKIEGDNNRPSRYLGRHIVIATVIDTQRRASFPHPVQPVVDMCASRSPLLETTSSHRNVYNTNQEEGSI